MIAGDSTPATRSEGVCAVWAHPFSESLKNMGWWASFRGVPLLEYCVGQLAGSTDWPLVLVSPYGGSRRARAAADRCGVQMCSVSSDNSVIGLTEASQLLSVDRILMVHGLFGLGLIPFEYLRELIAEHVASAAAVTMSAQLPSPLYAVLCERAVLRMLSELPRAFSIPDDPPQVLEVLIGAAGARKRSEKELTVHRKRFQERYRVDSRQLPKHIPWIFPRDRLLVEQALEAGGAQDPLAGLASLRDLLTDQMEGTRRKPSGVMSREPNRTTRVLFASNPSAYSGGEQCLVNTVEALRNQGFELHCLVALDGLFAERLRETGAIVHCPQHDFAQPIAANILQMDDLLEQVKPDVVHCNAIVGPPLLAVSRMRGIPLVQWVRVARMNGFADHLAFADRITAVSSFIAAIVSEEMVHTEKIRVLYDAVDVDRFSPRTKPARDVRQELGIAGNEFVVLCIARFAPYKRHDVLAHAVAQVYRKHPNLRLILVGEAQRGYEDYHNRCMKLLQDLDLVTRTTVMEFDSDVLSIESAADAIVLCSEDEPLGTVVLEGMALGRPIVVAASGGLPEMIQHGFSGLHCVPGDFNSLADRLSTLIEDRSLGESFGRNAREVAVERFSLAVHARTLRCLYEEIDSC